MARLETFPPERIVYTDECTGREVIQVTSGDADNRVTYAALCPFTADERFLLFSSNRTGRWEIYRAEIESGEIVRLTDRDGIRFESFNVAPPGRELFYGAGPRVWAVDIETGEERPAADASSIMEGPVASYLTFSPDGSKVLLQYKPRSGGESALAVAALDGAFVETVFVRSEGMQHARWVPTDERTASFAVSPDRQNDPEETRARRARAWQLDLETGKAFPLLVMPPGWRCTHEFWAPDGEKIFAHRKHVPNWTPASIVSVPKGGGEITTYYTTDDLKLGHSAATPDGHRVITDVQEPGRNPLLCIDLETGTAEALCRADASISRSEVGHGAHPHPSVSPSGAWVSFGSDRAGGRHVYLQRLSGEAGGPASCLEEKET